MSIILRFSRSATSHTWFCCLLNYLSSLSSARIFLCQRRLVLAVYANHTFALQKSEDNSIMQTFWLHPSTWKEPCPVWLNYLLALTRTQTIRSAKSLNRVSSRALQTGSPLASSLFPCLVHLHSWTQGVAGYWNNSGKRMVIGTRFHEDFMHLSNLMCREKRELIISHKRACDAVKQHYQGELPPGTPVVNHGGAGRSGMHVHV